MAEDRLTGLDASFLHIESDTSHMHVAGVMLFEGSPPEHDELVEALQRKMHLVPRYRQRLAFVPLGQGRPRWVDDPHFNLDYHVRKTALPPPGGEDQLRALAGRVFSQQLDRDKPLWEMWVVEGLDGGDRFAVLSKTHHALVDGISGVDIASVLFDVTPEPAPTPEPPRRWLPRPLPSRGQLLAEALIERATVPAEVARGVRAVFRTPRRIAGAAVGALAGVGAMAWTGINPAPPTPYNTSIGPHRRFTWVRVSLADVKAIKNSLGGTVNDVMLAIVAGALGRDLRRRGVDVKGLELKAMVPVSVRSDEARGALGNQVAAMMAPLPVGCEDPVVCLQTISRAMRRVKESGQALGAQVLTDLTGFAPPTIMGQASRLVVRQRFFNLVVTNVPGPQIPLYMMGRQMTEVFPMVPLAPNQAVGVAIMSYNGSINFGLVGDYDVMADLDHLARDFRAALTDLADAAGVELSAPGDVVREGRNGSRPRRRIGQATLSSVAPPAGGAAPPPEAPPPA
ncbi:MAG: wax ester/triacylglycerol synthase family O-acyltransferase [Actinomycetota bacterium]|nr:wax ester/triacylglycerol synthase family O-acyltransferase [Actinomycetota bacterium]